MQNMIERRGDLTLDTSAKLVILSGGQDSTTCLFQCVNDPTVTRLWAVSFDYGQRHRAELQASAFVYELARIAVTINRPPDEIEMPRWRQVIRLGRFAGDSPLTNPLRQLERYTSAEDMDAKLKDLVELTFVPGRNLGFLYEAGKLALQFGYGTLVVGVNDADAGNYPDCRREFIQAMERTWQLATRSNLRIEAPLMGMQKQRIVELATTLPGCMDAMAFTMTDYDGEYPPRDNHSSTLRADGFKKAGVRDPLLIRAEFEGWFA